MVMTDDVEVYSCDRITFANPADWLFEQTVIYMVLLLEYIDFSQPNKTNRCMVIYVTVAVLLSSIIGYIYTMQ